MEKREPHGTLGEQSRSAHYTFSNGAASDMQWEDCTVIFNLYTSAMVDYWLALNIVAKDDY